MGVERGFEGVDDNDDGGDEGGHFRVHLQELFVEMIAKDALVFAQQGKRKTLQRKDLGGFSRT